MTVPYNNHGGGAATPLPGASSPDYNETYPSLSSDDALPGYNRMPKDSNTYNQPQAELFVIPAAGGTGTRSVTTYPALYVRSQDGYEANHTPPAWDVFDIGIN